MPSASSVFNEHDVHDIAVLAAQISTDLPSLDSSLTTSPETSSLDPLSSESSLRLSTCSSRRHTPTVRFAPLPQTDPNRKRSIAPLGVSARSRRKRVPREQGASLWSADPVVPEDTLEDPLITFGKFVKNTSLILWRRVSKRGAACRVEDGRQRADRTAPIRLDVHRAQAQVLAMSSKRELGRIFHAEGKPTSRASWSPSTERGTLSGPVGDKHHRLRRSTGDLPFPP